MAPVQEGPLLSKHKTLPQSHFIQNRFQVWSAPFAQRLELLWGLLLTFQTFVTHS